MSSNGASSEQAVPSPPGPPAVVRRVQSQGAAVLRDLVETFEELIWLQASTSIHKAQGYYFSKPMLLPQLQQDRNHVASRPQSVTRQLASSRVIARRAG